MTINKKIEKLHLAAAEKVLIDNGVEVDEAPTVLQALCFALLDIDIDEIEAEPKKPDARGDMQMLEAKVSGIKWDFDGLEDYDIPNLPKKAKVNVLLREGYSTDELGDAIGDQLCGEYGFCNKGFTIDSVKVVR